MNEDNEFHPEIGEIGVLGEAGNIPTVYQFVTFRSRLEARWAVFFDAVGISWVYEPEQFNLGFARYTPDFFLEDGSKRMYVEIKPRFPLDEELHRIVALSLKTHEDVLLLGDLDNAETTSMHARYSFYPGHRGTLQGYYVHREEVVWAECTTCHKVWLFVHPYEFAVHTKDCSELGRMPLPKGYDYESSKIKKAMRIARSIALGM